MIKVLMMKRLLMIFLMLCVIVISSNAQYKTEYVVAQDGSGDFTTIQAAIDDCKAFPDEKITVHIKNGVYKEKVKIHSWNTRISLVGESKEKTIITYDDYFDKLDKGRNSTFYTYTLLVEGDDFHAENLTIENTAGRVGQAVALHVEADRCSFVNCRILGDQDTIFADWENSRQYFKDCYIEGTTDFIFGGSTAVFDNCTVFSKTDSYITAASTFEGVEFGYVFMDCNLEAAKDVTKVYLGRPWRIHAKTTFIGCNMGAHILPQGWHDWGKKTAGETVSYEEYNNSGPGYNPGQRVGWSKQLTKKQVKKYTIKNIFRGWLP